MLCYSNGNSTRRRKRKYLRLFSPRDSKVGLDRAYPALVLGDFAPARPVRAVILELAFGFGQITRGAAQTRAMAPTPLLGRPTPTLGQHGAARRGQDSQHRTHEHQGSTFVLQY